MHLHCRPRQTFRGAILNHHLRLSPCHSLTDLYLSPALLQVAVLKVYNKGGSVNGESIGFGAVQHHHAPVANQSNARLESLIDRMGPLVSQASTRTSYSFDVLHHLTSRPFVQVEGMELNHKRTRRNVEESEELLVEAKVQSRKVFRKIYTQVGHCLVSVRL